MHFLCGALPVQHVHSGVKAGCRGHTTILTATCAARKLYEHSPVLNMA